MSEKLNIEQLIKSSLGEAELSPSPGVWKVVRRNLRWKQFARFNPGKLNIYYLGSLFLAGAGLIILFTRSVQEIEESSVSVDSKTIMQEISPNLKHKIESKDAVEVLDNIGQPEDQSEMSPLESDQPVIKVEGDLSPDNNDTLKAKEENLSANNRTSNQINEPPAQSTLVTYFVSSVSSGCIPLSVQFSNQSINSTQSIWSFGTGEKIEDENPVFTFEEAGKYAVTLTAENAMGQSSTYQQFIEVYPAPRAEFEIEDGFEDINGHVAINIVNYSEGTMSYSWTLLNKNETTFRDWASNDFQPSIKLSDLQQTTRKIRLFAINEFGCTDTFTVPIPIVVESSRAKIKFPNAFSPSPLGPVGGSFSPHEKRADLFHPFFIEEPLEYHLRIYTRRGELIFETRDIYQGWDGYIKQERSLGGVYVWMVEGVWNNGEEIKLHGDVTLIWNDIW